MAVWLSPETMASTAAGPAVALAVKVSGEPARPAAVAVADWLLVPATVPMVQPDVAMPAASVTDDATVVLPLPAPAAQLTVTPDFTLP